MISNYQKVREFHKSFNNVIDASFDGLNQDYIKFRIALIKEELAELEQGLAKQDKANIAKELADILYVTYGFAVAIGLDMDEAFNLVHESNMSKSLNGTNNVANVVEGKAVKGENYHKAVLEGLVRDI